MVVIMLELAPSSAHPRQAVDTTPRRARAPARDHGRAVNFSWNAARAALS
jgi:hypothetical protein